MVVVCFGQHLLSKLTIWYQPTFGLRQWIKMSGYSGLGFISTESVYDHRSFTIGRFIPGKGKYVEYGTCMLSRSAMPQYSKHQRQTSVLIAGARFTSKGAFILILLTLIQCGGNLGTGRLIWIFHQRVKQEDTMQHCNLDMVYDDT